MTSLIQNICHRCQKTQQISSHFVKCQHKLTRKSKKLFNSSSMSILLANMKLYDNKQIFRQNQKIKNYQRMSKMQQSLKLGAQQIQFQIAANEKCALKLNGLMEKKEEAKIQMKQFTNQNKQVVNKNLHSKYQCKIGKTDKQLFNYLNQSFIVFNILQARLKELTNFINVINQIEKIPIRQSERPNEVRKCLQSVISVLQQICDVLEQKMKKIKNYNQKWFQQLQNKQNEDPSNKSKAKGKNQGENYDLFDMKKYARLFMVQLKEIQTKYTKISRQIIERQNRYNKYRLCSNRIEESQDGEMFRIKISCELDPKNQNNNKIQQNGDVNFKENQNIYLSIPNSSQSLTYRNNLVHFKENNEQKFSTNYVTNRSILKKKNRFQNGEDKNKQKRISLQVITSMLQSQRAEKIRKMFADSSQTNKKSKFHHREGFNIGSGIAIRQQFSSRNRKNNKKQVKIQSVQTQQKANQQTVIKLGTVGNKKSRSNSHKQSLNAQQMEQEEQQKQQCEGLRDKEKTNSKKKQDEIGTLERQRQNRIYSYQQDKSGNIKSRSRSQSRSKSRSNRSKSRNIFGKKNSTRRNTRRQIKKYSAAFRMYRKQESSQSIDKNNLNISKSLRHIGNKDQFQIKASLKNLILLAMESKKNDKYGCRSGQLITKQLQKDEENQDFNRLRIDFAYKRVAKKQKSKILRRDLQKQMKYSELLGTLKQIKDKNGFQKINLKNMKPQKPNIEPKSVRRIGMNNLGIFDKIKTEQQQKKIEKSPNKSQTSAPGSKKHNCSNQRLTVQYELQEEQSIEKQRHKTEQNQSTSKYSQFTVKFEDRLTFLSNFVKFYPNIQCSLYKITKQNQKQQMMRLYETKAETKILQEFGQIPNFYVKKFVQQQCLEVESRQLEMKKMKFQQQGQMLKFSKIFTASNNQLDQKQMLEYGLSETSHTLTRRSRQRSGKVLFQYDNNIF